MDYEPQNVLDPRAPNFKMYEVAKSATAERLHIDNTPDPESLERARLLAVHCLQPIRNKFGRCSPQSWFRCEELEKTITKSGFKFWCQTNGKDVNSEAAWQEYFSKKSHPKGEAADIEIVGVSNDELFEWCKKNLKFDQLIREFPKEGDPRSGWVHISYRKDNNRQMSFVIK